MCGIIGIISKKEFSVKEDLLKALKRLEYRGYDSVGYATINGDVETAVGSIDDFSTKIKDRKARIAIAHTRWSTHGRVSKENAHPHFNEDKTLFIVHNGIIENYAEMKEKLEQKGHSFSSETDSEVIAHYFEDKFKEKPDKEAITDFMNDAKGTFAILMFQKSSSRIYALKRDSPLVLGISKDALYLSSDIYAFSNKTNKAAFFEDNEFAIINQDISYETYVVENKAYKAVKKQLKEFVWKEATEADKKFRHFMIKEIHEEPVVSEFLLNSLENSQQKNVKVFLNLIRKSKKVIFAACGTSYHASIFGEHLFNGIGIDAETFVASEFNPFKLNKEVLVIAISQSGETMDLLKAIKKAKESDAKIASIVNVPYSSIQRLSDASIEICAGQEICVASTKTFVNQVLALLYIVKKLGYKTELEKVPEKISETINKNQTKAELLAKKISQCRDIYIIGRKICYASALETALKIKEISYIHAEGMMGGELKHGTLALIEKGVPVISLVPNNNAQIISNAKEIESRDAFTISIVNSRTDFKADFEFIVPESSDIDDIEFALYSVIIGQLITYYIALEKKLPIDKPRNLAKSVTVE